MIVALIDNGSLEPAAHRNLRALAKALTARTGVEVHPVSWKHSNRIRATALGGVPAWTLTPWVSAQVDRGERDLLFIPFFVSAQGAIGSALREDLENLQHQLGGFRFALTPGLAAQRALVRITVAQIRETIAANQLEQPPVVIVDHGGPSPASSSLRNQVTEDVARELGTEIRRITAASLEGEEYPHNHPLFVDALASAGFDRGDIVVAPLFLAPGRHAGPQGDLAQIAAAAEDRGAATRPEALKPLHCHFTPLIGAHPYVVDVLADALTQTISSFHAAA